MGYFHKCTRCKVSFERGIPTLRVVTHTRENVPLCDECTEELRQFLKGGCVVPYIHIKDVREMERIERSKNE